MDLYYLEKRRRDLLDDHPYALPDTVGAGTYKGESILTEAIPDLSTSTEELLSPGWISVDEDGTAVIKSDTASRSDHEGSSSFVVQALHMDLGQVRKDPRHHWVQPSTVFQKKMLNLLEKCYLQQTLDSSRFTDMSEFACFQRRQTNQILRIRRLSRYLRNIFAMQSWQIERCFAFHQWCLSRLPDRLLRLYCDAYTNLWNQNKINSLLTVLNKLSRDRGIPLQNLPETPASRPPQLCDSLYRYQNRQLQSHALSSNHDPRSGLSSAFLFNNPQRHGGEEVILACFTFPASPTSNRLNRLLNELSEIGRVSVETPEEQACDVMRLRFRLYNRRVLTLLEEPKRGPIYLVGFGVGSILVLSSAMHLQSADLRDDRYGIAGLICLGMPLIGLKGPRGYPNDPLLSIPEVPTLFIVGSASRLGGHKQALYFRRLILHARLKSQLGNTPDGTDVSRDSFSEDQVGHAPSSPGTSSLHSRASNVSVLTVGGADYLLRLRPSLCERWCTTQEAVDKRIVDAIRRFILATDHTMPSPYPSFTDLTSVDSPPDTPNHYDMCRIHAMQSFGNSLPFRSRSASSGFGHCISPTHCSDFVTGAAQHRRLHSLARRAHISGPSNAEFFPN